MHSTVRLDQSSIMDLCEDGGEGFFYFYNFTRSGFLSTTFELYCSVKLLSGLGTATYSLLLLFFQILQ